MNDKTYCVSWMFQEISTAKNGWFGTGLLSLLFVSIEPQKLVQ
jgi:hypothetical protein